MVLMMVIDTPLVDDVPEDELPEDGESPEIVEEEPRDDDVGT